MEDLGTWISEFGMTPLSFGHLPVGENPNKIISKCVLAFWNWNLELGISFDFDPLTKIN